jgi:hypothetical protein
MAEKKKSFGKLIARKLFGGKARTAKKDREKKEYDERKKKAESKYPKKLKKLTKNVKKAQKKFKDKEEEKAWKKKYGISEEYPYGPPGLFGGAGGSPY